VTGYTHILLILTTVYKVMAGLCLDLRMNNGCFSFILVPDTAITFLLQTHIAINPFLQRKTAHCAVSLMSEHPFTAIQKQ